MFNIGKNLLKAFCNQPVPKLRALLEAPCILKSQEKWFHQISRSSFHTTTKAFIKEIIVKEEDKCTVVEGVQVKSPREHLVVETGKEDQKVCPLCALDLNLKHTDVLILSQFLRSDGCLLPRRVTGLCNRQQKVVESLVAMSQKAGLMPNITPGNSNKDPAKRFGSKKLNRYFDESTIRLYKVKYPKPRESKVDKRSYDLFLEKYHRFGYMRKSAYLQRLRRR